MNSNMEQFNQITAELFAHLYINFPVQQAFTYERWGCEFPDDYWEAPNSPEAKGVMAKQAIMDGTFKFLNDSGYINYTRASGGGYLNVSLTEKALLSLKLHPKSLTVEETFGDRIVSAVKDGAEEKVKSALSAFMTAALTGFGLGG